MFIVSLVDGKNYHILDINLIKHHIKRHKENTFTHHFKELVLPISPCVLDLFVFLSFQETNHLKFIMGSWGWMDNCDKAITTSD